MKTKELTLMTKIMKMNKIRNKDLNKINFRTYHSEA